MILPISELQTRISALEEKLAKLSLHLERALDNVRRIAAPPDANLVEEIGATQKEFDALCANLLGLAASCGITSPKSPDQIVSLQDLRELIRTIEERHEATARARQQVAQTLDRMLSLRFDGPDELIELSHTQNEARRLLGLLAEPSSVTLPGEIHSIADGKHVFTKLLTLVEDWQKLDFNQARQLRDAITKGLGERLAYEAGRGKIALSNESSLPQPAQEENKPLRQPLPAESDPATNANEETVIPQSPTAGFNSAVTKEITTDQTVPTSDDSNTIPAQTEPNDEITIEPPLVQEGNQPERQKEPGSDDAVVAEQRLSRYFKEDSAQKIAAGIIENNWDNLYAELRELVWQLISEERPGLAFHLARAMEAQFPEQRPQLPLWIVHALALSRHVRYESGEIARLLAEDFSFYNRDVFTAGENAPAKEWNHAIRFMIVAAALRTALLAPGTMASNVLEDLRLKARQESLFSYVKAIVAFAGQFQALDLLALRDLKSSADWQKEMIALQRKVSDWMAIARKRDMNNGQARNVWNNWVGANGVIGGLLQPILQNKPPDNQRVLQQLEKRAIELSNDDEIELLINQTNRQIRKKGADKIVGIALELICTHTREASGFVLDWIALQKSRSELFVGASQSQAAQLRSDLMALQPEVLKELDQFKTDRPSRIVSSAISACRRSVNDLSRLFDSKNELPREEPSPKELLSADLMRIPAIPLNEQWEPKDVAPDTIIAGIVRLLAESDFDWRRAFDARLKHGDHESTQRIIDYIACQSEQVVNPDALRTARNNHIRECQIELRKDADQTRRAVDEAFNHGLLREPERIEHIAQVENVEQAISHTLRFFEQRALLLKIRDAVESSRKTEIAVIRRRLDAALNPPDPTAREHPHVENIRQAEPRIRALLDAKDALTADEYLRQAESGEPLPDPVKSTEGFWEFFPGAINEILKFLSQSSQDDAVQDLIKQLRSRIGLRKKTVPPALSHLTELQPDQAHRAADLLDTWFKAKQWQRANQRVNESRLETLFELLGFASPKIISQRSGTYTSYDLHAGALRDRRQCSIPAYGSGARGRYRLFFFWRNETFEAIFDEITQNARQRPVIILYFGRLTVEKRRELARMCRQNKTTTIIIDDVFALYLCGMQKRQLGELFECALPFTSLDPFVPTGPVPPEMFFGRREEYAKVTGLSRHCFIYGGRQFGKTALLRQAQESFHTWNKERPKEGQQAAIYYDLNDFGVGLDRTIDDLWHSLADKLREMGLINDKPSQPDIKKLTPLIEAWLKEKSERRLLLLLDEADNFLRIDGQKGFQNAAHLEGLMNRTDHHFKVVFTGLHNVLRATRDPNHPLARYGEPICIGPLSSGNDLREARKLIQEPFANLGYRFASPDLITRILSQTGYYPSLVQLYCSYLLHNITRPHIATFDPKTTPPYEITLRHVENAYKDEDLRKAIRDRFLWTLQLDDRYRVIAYVIALYSLTFGAEPEIDGFPVPWIREQTLTWWESGFRDSSAVEDFRVLLDEMVEMGVLRTNNKHYALRSPNMALLLGTQSEIEATLLDTSQFELPVIYEAATFHSTYDSDKSRRSPLTAQQTYELIEPKHGVSLICGSLAAGLAALKPALAKRLGADLLTFLDRATNREAFQRALESLRKRETDAITLLLVSADCGWDADWVIEATRSVANLSSKRSFARVAFVADPSKVWRWLNRDTGRENNALTSQVTTFSLTHWHDNALNQWLDDCGFPKQRSVREEIARVTGNWPILLQEFYQSSRSELHNWKAHLEALDDLLRGRKKRQEAPDGESKRKTDAAFGLDCQEPCATLRMLAILEEKARIEQLADLSEGVKPEVILRALEWADLLSFARRGEEDYWQLNPVVSLLLNPKQE